MYNEKGKKQKSNQTRPPSHDNEIDKLSPFSGCKSYKVNKDSSSENISFFDLFKAVNGR